MKAWIARSLTGPDALELIDHESCAPLEPGQVRVGIRAASINARDLLILNGAFRTLTIPDLIPLSDCAGEVLEVGEGVWRVHVGTRVAVTFHPDWMGGQWEPTPSGLGRGGATQGVLRERITVHQNELVPIPEHLSFQEAATLPCAAVTAWTALTLGATPMPGETVLVQGTGGVSIFALQLAKLFGMRVIVTTSVAAKIDQLSQLGADVIIDTKILPRWDAEVIRATGGEGVDRVVEVGGASTIAQSIASVRLGGRISIVGLLSGIPEHMPGLFMRGPELKIARVGSRTDFVSMNRAVSYHQLRPVIHRVYSFRDAKHAVADFALGGHVGKIVIAIE